MPLQAQALGIPITGGLNTRPSEFDLQPGDLATATNIEQRRGNVLIKRNGQQEFTNACTGRPDGATSLTSGNSVFSDGENLFCHDGTSIYTYEVAASAWRRLGPLWDVDLRLDNVQGLVSTVFGRTTCAASTNFIAYGTFVFDSGTFVQFFVLDRVTRNIVSYTVPSAFPAASITSESRIRAVTVNDDILFLFANDDGPSTISCVGVNSITGAITLRYKITDGNNSRLLDVGGVFQGDIGGSSFFKAVIAYPTAAGYRLREIYESSASATITGSVAEAVVGDIAIAVGGVTSSPYAFVSYGFGLDTRIAGFNLDATYTTRFAPAPMLVGRSPRQLAGIVTEPTTGTRFTFFCEQLNTSVGIDPGATALYRYSADSSNANITGIYSGSGNLFAYPISLASKPWCTPQRGADIGQVCIAAMVDSSTEGSIVVLTEGPLAASAAKTPLEPMNSTTVGRLGFGQVKQANTSDVALLGDYYSSTSFLGVTPAPVHFAACGIADIVFFPLVAPGVPQLRSSLVGVTVTPGSIIGSVTSSATPQFSLQTPFSNSKRIATQRGISGTYILGSQLMYYDGINFFDPGFIRRPIITATSSATAGSLVAGQTYTYCATFSFLDANGRKYESSPSAAVSVLILPGNSSVLFSSTAPDTLSRIIFAAGNNLTLNVYRTLAVGTTFRNLAFTNAVGFVGIAGPITFTDTLSDASLAAQPLLYTESGEVPNDPIPSPNAIEARNGVIYAIVGKNELWYSKPETVDTGISFSPILSTTLPTENGEAISMANLDDKLVTLHERASYTFAGDAPNSLGIGQLFGPTLVTGALGTINPRSVLSMEYGVIFQSPRGVYLLDRSLSYSYIGEKIQNINSGGDNSFIVDDACLVSYKNQLRLTISTGPLSTTLGTLVLDLQQQRWAFHQYFSPESGPRYYSTSHKQTGPTDYYVSMQTNGEAFQENAETYNDFGNHFTKTIKTGWIHLAGMQGFQRIRNISLLAYRYSSGQLTVNIYYDYNTASPQVVTVSTSTLGTGRAQLKIIPTQQKCEAVQIEVIEETTGSTVATLGRGIDLFELSVEVAGKSGIFRLPAANSR